MKVYNRTAACKMRHAARMREQYAPRSSVYFIDCRFCGSLATMRSATATRCNRAECKRAFNAERMREGGWAIVVTDRRRKRIRDVTVETFRRIDVFERDGWICGICTDPVDRNLKGPDPMAPSLDHIEPLSLGGHHTWDNCRLAHLRCNIRRGNRVETISA